jgi:hypothetical protein
MAGLLYLAAFLAVALGIAHSFLGEQYILVRLFRRKDLPQLFGSADFTIRTLRFAWHVTTIALWGFAALLVLLGQGRVSPSSAALVIGCTLVASGFLPLVITRGKHMSWLVLFIIGGIALAKGAT